MNLTAKLTTIFLVLSIAPLAVVGYLAYDNGRGTIIDNTNNHLISTTILKEAEFERWLYGTELVVRAVASRPLVRELAAALSELEPGTPEFQAAHDDLLNNHFLSVQAESQEYTEWFLVRASDGTIIVDTNPTFEGQISEDATYSLEDSLEPAAGGASASESSPRKVIHIAAPVLDSTGAVVALVGRHIEMGNAMAIMLQSRELKTSEETYLVDVAKLMLTDSRTVPNAASNLIVDTQATADCLAGHNGTGTYKDYRGIVVMGAYRWMPQRQVCIITEIDRSEALAPVADLRSTIVAVMLGASLITAILAGVFARTLTGPLRQLVLGTQEIGRGNLEYQLAIPSRDEIGQLATSFNEMAVHLRQSVESVAHGQRLLLALSQAGQAVQQTRTPQEVYDAVSAEITELGFHAVVFRLTEDQAHLRVDSLTFSPETLAKMEQLTSASALGHTFPLNPDGIFGQVIGQETTVFSPGLSEGVVNLLPENARASAAQFASLLQLKESIFAPMTIDHDVQAVLMVTGIGLTESDVPAVTAFANQAGVALENAQLYQEVQGHAEHLVQLVDERTQALQENEALFRHTFEQAAVGVAHVSPDGQFLRVNRRFCDIVGYTPEEMLTNDFQSITYPDDLEADLGLTRRALKGEIASYSLEKRYIHRDGSLVWVDLTVSLVRDSSNAPHYFISVIQDISERKQYERDLDQQRHLLRTLIDALPVYIYVKDMESRFLVANAALARAFGVQSPEDVVGKTDHAFSLKELADAYLVEEQEVIRAGKALYNHETYGVNHDGQETWTLGTRVPLRDKDGAIVGLVGINQDVTELKQTEQALRESQQLLRTVLDTIPIRVFWKDTDLNYLGSNLSFARDAEVDSPQDLLGKTDFDLVWADRAELYRADDREVLAQGTPKLNFEEPLTRPDGSSWWLRTSKIPLRNDKGAIVGILGAYEDITERRRVERALAEKTEELDRFFSLAVDMLCIANTDGYFLRVSAAWETTLGYTISDLEGMRFLDLVHPDDLEHTLDTVGELTDGQIVTQFVNRYRHADGSYRWLEWHSIPYQNTMIYASARDITENRLAREELEASKQFSDDIINGLPGLFYMYNDLGELVRWNQRFQQVSGYSAEELTFKPAVDLFEGEYKTLIAERMQIVYTLGQSDAEADFVSKDGTKAPYFFTGVRISREGKMYLLGVGTDISVRVEAQRKIAELAAIVESSDDAIIGKSMDGLITSWNAGAQKMYGYPPSEAVGQPVSFLVPPHHQDEMPHILDRLVLGKHIDTFESLRRKKTGEIFNVSITVSPIYDAQGRITGASTITRDMTDRKRFEDALRASEERFRAIFEKSTGGYALTAPDATLIKVNSAFANLLGYTEDELPHVNLEEITFIEDIPESQQRLRSLLDGERQTSIMEKRYLHREGHVIWALVNTTLLHDEQGQPDFFISNVQDITERKHYEKMLEELNETLARSNTELEQFAYVASHDLQEPLRMVTSYLQLLERRYSDQLDSNAHEFIDYAVDGAVRMKALINDLLAFSRVGTRGKPFAPTRMELVLDQTLSNLQMSISEYGATVTHDPLPEVSGDEGQLQQLLQNLIGNAIKFHGDAPPAIHVGVRQADRCWEFSVSDNGIGIDPEYFERVFIIFQRLHNKQDYPGTGIGLAICKKIVLRHQGRIWIESRAGQGSTFYFTLPMQETPPHETD